MLSQSNPATGLLKGDRVAEPTYAPHWTQVLSPGEIISGERELDWLELAQQGQATAAVWTGRQELVAPLLCRRFPDFAAACALSAESGWPVRLRRSGGGVVPQGSGILNVSLAYPCTRAPGDLADATYASICNILSEALAGLGIEAFAHNVEGSFCDGRFNLAVAGDGAPRKIAGTAQYWRRAGNHYAVLVHALLVVDADPLALTAAANRFEAALGSGRQYDANALTNVSQAWSAAHHDQTVPVALLTELPQRIIAALMMFNPEGEYYGIT